MRRPTTKKKSRFHHVRPGGLLRTFLWFLGSAIVTSRVTRATGHVPDKDVTLTTFDDGRTYALHSHTRSPQIGVHFYIILKLNVKLSHVSTHDTRSLAVQICK